MNDIERVRKNGEKKKKGWDGMENEMKNKRGDLKKNPS